MSVTFSNIDLIGEFGEAAPMHCVYIWTNKIYGIG
jgi:hypothetical protein